MCQSQSEDESQISVSEYLESINDARPECIRLVFVVGVAWGRVMLPADFHGIVPRVGELIGPEDATAILRVREVVHMPNSVENGVSYYDIVLKLERVLP